MTFSLDTLNLDLLHLDQEERIAAIRRAYEHREQLKLVGYVSAVARARAATAGWLLHLAVCLDDGVAARVASATPGLGMRTA